MAIVFGVSMLVVWVLFVPEPSESAETDEAPSPLGLAQDSEPDPSAASEAEV